MIQVNRIRRVFEDAEKLSDTPYIRGCNTLVGIKNCHCAGAWLMRSINVSDFEIDHETIWTLWRQNYQRVNANFGLDEVDFHRVVAVFDKKGIEGVRQLLDNWEREEVLMK